MSNDPSPSVEEQLSELTQTLAELQAQLVRQRRPPMVLRPPNRAELRTFTSEVAIPGLILLLETNVRVLKLLQRTLRLADDDRPAGQMATTRANELGAAALGKLDDTLADLQSALAGDPPDSDARELLEQARSLQRDIETTLSDGETDGQAVGPSVDVEAELQSIKDQVDDEDDDTKT